MGGLAVAVELRRVAVPQEAEVDVDDVLLRAADEGQWLPGNLPEPESNAPAVDAAMEESESQA